MAAKIKKSTTAAAKSTLKSTPMKPGAPIASAPSPVKPAAPIVKSPVPQPSVTPEQRQKQIEVEAYYLAEKNGFKGDPSTYWAQAEKIVNAKLGLKK